MKTLIVEYNQNKGDHPRDGECQEYVDNTINEFDNSLNSSYTVLIASELLIEFFRIAVIDGKINHNQLKFKFKDELIDVGDNANLSHWPNGFGDMNLKCLSKLAGIGKYRK